MDYTPARLPLYSYQNNFEWGEHMTTPTLSLTNSSDKIPLNQHTCVMMCRLE